jgi:DNA-binding CsgD family transcriptional regulator
MSDSAHARKLLDAVAFIGQAPDMEGMYRRTLSELLRLVPADQSYACITEINRWSGTEAVSLIGDSLGEDVRRPYIEYYYKIDQAKNATPPDMRYSQEDWRQRKYNRNEFTVEFIRRIMHIDMSAGIIIVKPSDGWRTMFGLSRTARRRLSDRAVWFMSELQPHLANFCSIYRQFPALPEECIWAAELADDCRLLSRREAQVASLLCKRLRPAQITSVLLVSPRTVERHIENNYGKLQVRSRNELLKKLLV